MKKAALFLLSVSLFAVSCNFIDGERVRGNGNMKTENRTPGNFTGVKSDGFFDVYLSVGNTNSVKIEGEENLLPLIETYVEGDVLKITTKEGYNIDTRRDMKIFITAPSYTVVQCNGSGNITGETKISSTGTLDVGVFGSGNVKLDVNAPEVEASIAGSGNLNLIGETKRFSSDITGSGDIRAMELKAEEAKATITGSGNTEVYASVKLDVRIVGSGDVRYKGGAAVNTNSVGSGSVKKLD
jgi:hypothetical protein